LPTPNLLYKDGPINPAASLHWGGASRDRMPRYGTARRNIPELTFSAGTNTEFNPLGVRSMRHMRVLFYMEILVIEITKRHNPIPIEYL
jgi:hypothetical protein